LSMRGLDGLDGFEKSREVVEMKLDFVRLLE
jgi:hypothetical protein